MLCARKASPIRLACSTPRDERFTSSAQFPGARCPIPSRMSTCVWRNKITLPPCFNAAQTCSSSAPTRRGKSVSETNRQRSKVDVRLVELVSMVAKILHNYVCLWPLADMRLSWCSANVCFRYPKRMFPDKCPLSVLGRG